jgi:hypothetical protein
VVPPLAISFSLDNFSVNGFINKEWIKKGLLIKLSEYTVSINDLLTTPMKDYFNNYTLPSYNTNP